MINDAFKDIEKLEADLWEAADNLRANSKLTSSDYFMPVLGVIFLRHAANRFEAAHRQIEEEQATGKMPKRKVLPADYLRRRALYLPEAARDDVIMEKAAVRGADLPKLVKQAMEATEKEFDPLRGVLPKDFGLFEPKVLEELMRLFNSEQIKQATGDVFGRIYEYFLAEFSMQKAHDNGEFFTPSSIVQTIVNSEAQNEVRDFQKWGFDIIPHRVVMKTGFETPDGKRVNVEDAFKDPQHPFRIAIVCAMWLTGFDVECLSTLYIDKPMKAHTLMQAIARANRVYPGKDCGVIVDYNGMLKSLRAALAQYALGDEDEGGAEDSALVEPIEVLVAALVQAIEAAEAHLRSLGFEPSRLPGPPGFARVAALRDAVDALYTSDEAKRRFEIMARQVFLRFKTLLMEPSAFTYAERHDAIEAIYKKLQEKRDTANVTEVLKELHRIVNEAIRAAPPGEDHTPGLTVDLSQIDFEKLRDEFATRVRRKHAALRDIRDVIERKLEQMLALNPLRMDYYRKYQEIIAAYNREKDRVTVEATIAQLFDLAGDLDSEERRHVKEGLSERELALFDLLFKDNLSKADRERLKQASRDLLASIQELLRSMHDWTQSTTTQSEVRIRIVDNLWQALPKPPFTDEETEAAAERVYNYVWQQSRSGHDLAAA